MELSQAQIEQFRENGFLFVEGFVELPLVEQAGARFEALFGGAFETGLQPDEWNWREGRDSPELTRQICNGWKSDRAVARIVLREDIGRACARLMDWPGARLNQDNVIWKPPGAKSLGFHQDDSYQDWVEPTQMVSAWVALDDTTAEGGTLLYAKGSHRWPVAPPIAQFHAPDDFTLEFRQAAEEVGEGDCALVPVVLRKGGVAFHHGRTWHGSGPNLGQAPRRSVVAHCMHADARFREGTVGPIYGRYKRFGSTEMEESFFPILWRSDGGRSAFLSEYLA